MNIWLLAVGDPAYGPGADRPFRCGMLAQKLNALGHKPTWWASTFDHNSKKHVCNATERFCAPDGTQIVLLHGPGYSRNRSLQRVRHHGALALEYERISSGEPRPDLIFCCLPTLEMVWASVAYAGAQNVPLIVDIRDLWPDLYLSAVPRFLRGLLRVALHSEFLRTSRALAQATGITAISHGYLDWALRYARRNQRAEDGVFELGYQMRANSNGHAAHKRTNETLHRFGLSENDFLVVFSGTFVHSFDFQSVICAARRMQARNQTSVKFVFAGAGEREHELLEAVADLPNVIITGWLNATELDELLRSAHIGLAPYRRDAYMSLPNKPFEYMAYGLPILSSLPGELRQILESNRVGVFYESDSGDSLDLALRQLIDSPRLRAEMGANAEQLFKDRFSSTRVYSRLADHLLRVATRSPAGTDTGVGAPGEDRD